MCRCATPDSVTDDNNNLKDKLYDCSTEFLFIVNTNIGLLVILLPSCNLFPVSCKLFFLFQNEIIRKFSAFLSNLLQRKHIFIPENVFIGFFKKISSNLNQKNMKEYDQQLLKRPPSEYHMIRTA
jgi:hypothetical protein